MNAPLHELSDEQLQLMLDSLRSDKELVQRDLRAAVYEHDRRVAMRDILKRHPNAARILSPRGIQSQEKVGN